MTAPRPLLALIAVFLWQFLANPLAASELTPGPKIGQLQYLKTPIHHYCKNDPNVAETPAREDQASGRSNRQPRDPSPFFGAEILNVAYDFVDDSCGEPCGTAVTQALIQSLALWRSGCSRCQAENLIAIAINGDVWLDTVTIDKWRYALRADSSSATEDPKSQQRMSLRPLGFQPVVDFRIVDPGKDKALCGAARRYASSTEVTEAVCTGNLPTCDGPGCLTLPVRIGKGKACSLISRIACGAADGEIALNTLDYTFHHALQHVVGASDVRFGSGEYEVELFPVLLHEVGHWFGLIHEKEGDVARSSIMRNVYSYTTPWCLTEWNLVQVDNAVDKNWDFRLGGAHGLIYAEGEL